MKTAFQLINQRTLGPLSDLEKHLPPDWWKNLSSSLFLKNDTDVNDGSLEEIDWLIQALNLKPHQHIIDLCCGQGRHSLILAEKQYHRIVGIDRSRYLIRLARRRAKKSNLCVKFREGDARNIRLPNNSQHAVFVFGNSFGYFERKEDDYLVLSSIKRILHSEGGLAIDLTNGTWLRNHFELRSWEWIDKNHFVCRERSLTENNSRIVTREVLVHAEKGVITDQFYAEKLYDKESIYSLLKETGFSNIEIETISISPQPPNQQTESIPQRMYITAKGPLKTEVRKKGVVKQPLTILLGDPSLPDNVKREGQYNPEDLATVARLKEALNSLDGYVIKYLNNHSKLILELMTNPPSFVINLCDEGYQNQATMEQHVPSMLEMLKIPYSGAGPDCLSLCYNKSIVRAIAFDLDIPVPDETYFGSLDQAASLPSVFPALLKPNFGDNSIGITQKAVVYTAEEFMAYLTTLKDQFSDMPILVQEFLEGKEYSVGITGNIDNFSILPLLEVNYDALPQHLPQILGYESKWDPSSPYWTDISYQEATLDEEEARKLIEYSIRLFERCNCKDYARFDFRTDKNGKIKLLEVNPNPGWCWDGKMNKMASMQGMDYPTFLEMIIKSAKDRYQQHKEKA